MSYVQLAKSIRKTILPLAAIMLLLGLQATAANAAATHPLTPAARAHPALPAITPRGKLQVSDWYYGLDNQFVTCTAGDHAAPSNLYNLTPGYSFVINDCNVRVWLTQTTSGTGYELCLSPGAGPIYIYRPYHDVGVSSNGSPC